MQELQFGLFENFKGRTTLLIWGDGEGLPALQAAFRQLGNGVREALLLHQAGWAKAVGNEEVYLRIANGRPSMSVYTTEHGAAVDCRYSHSDFCNFADMVAELISATGNGHQYLEAAVDQPLQIMVSKGEYPRDLSTTAAARP